MPPTPHFGILTVFAIPNNSQKFADLDFKEMKLIGKDSITTQIKEKETDMQQFCTANNVRFKIIQTQPKIN